MGGCYFDLQLKKKRKKKKRDEVSVGYNTFKSVNEIFDENWRQIYLLVSPLTNYDKPNTDGIIDIIFIYFLNYFYYVGIITGGTYSIANYIENFRRIFSIAIVIKSLITLKISDGYFPSLLSSNIINVIFLISNFIVIW